MSPALAAVAFLLAAGADDGLKAKIDPLAAELLKDKKNAGLVVGVYKDGKPHVYGYGTVFLRTGGQTPNRRTLFAIGSITKVFTGVLLADAVRRGEVKLDAPANDFLPPDLKLPQVGDKPITLEHLATHTSGLPVGPPFVGAKARNWKNPYADFDRERLAEMLGTLKPGRGPGVKHEYSNLGAGVAGHALAHAAKASSFDALLQERLCRPLGLPDTAEALTGDQLARLARGHTDKGEPGPHWDFATLSACGGLKSTADDLLRFAAATLGDVKTDLAPAFAESLKFRRDGSGLFWLVVPKDGKTAAADHAGGTYVARSRLTLIPSQKLAVVVLGSWSDEGVIELGEKVLVAAVQK